MNRELSIYDKLLELPLFQGMSKNDLHQIVAYAKFDFNKVRPSRTIVKEGSPFSYLYFLMDGTAYSETKADDGRFMVREDFSAPNILQPEHIFGMTQHFSSTYYARSACSFVRLEKKTIYELAADYEVFRINLLNIISTQSQRLMRQPWRTLPQTIRQKIGRFVEAHCRRPAGRKEIAIKMEQLAQEIGESRLNLSHELHRMQKEELLEISRGHIFIPALERLLM